MFELRLLAPEDRVETVSDALEALERGGSTVFDAFPINVADPKTFIGLLIGGSIAFLFSALAIALPNNTSYIHLTAAFVFVQGLGYWFVWQDPPANLGIVKLGIVYKAIFSGLAFYYLAIGELLHPAFLIFAVADVLVLGLVVLLFNPSGPEAQAWGVVISTDKDLVQVVRLLLAHRAGLLVLRLALLVGLVGIFDDRDTVGQLERGPGLHDGSLVHDDQVVGSLGCRAGSK